MRMMFFVDEGLLVGQLSAARVKNCLSLAESLRTLCIHTVGGDVVLNLGCQKGYWFYLEVESGDNLNTGSLDQN